MLFFLSLTGGALPYGSIVLGLEPFDGIGLVDAVGGTDVGLASSALGNAKTWARPGSRREINVSSPRYGSSHIPIHAARYSHPFLSSPSRVFEKNSHNAVKVHSVNTDSWVILDAQIDVLRDTEAEVSSLRKVLLAQLVLLDLQTTLDDLLSLGSADGDVYGNLLVTTDTECTDGVARLAVYGGLTGKLLKHLGGTRKPISGFTDGDVENCGLLESAML